MTTDSQKRCNNARRIWGVFANAKIQCEESVSSSTPQNCATTNVDSLFCGNNIPQEENTIITQTHKHLSVRSERNTLHLPLVPRELLLRYT